MEVQRRKLMLLDEERRNDALAVLRLEEEQGRRQREIAVAERRRCAATGAYQCLLDLKQPVAAAQAARMRLEMCETQNERVQVGGVLAVNHYVILSVSHSCCHLEKGSVVRCRGATTCHDYDERY